MSKIVETINRLKESLPQNVKLIAVSKTHPIDAIQEAYDGGQRIFAESRPQEMKAKYEALPKDIEWHMIGHLQTNKIKMIIPFVTLIQSVDSQRLLLAIEREAEKVGRKVDVLLEIRVAKEETKTGWAIDELSAFLKEISLSDFPFIRFRGVMGIATNTDDEQIIRKDFSQLHQYFTEFKPLFGEEFDSISMGMSDDYPIAVECGSTMVRVGSLIFGERDYSK